MEFDITYVTTMFPLSGVSRPEIRVLKVRIGHYKTEINRNLFTKREVNLWNSLSKRDAETVSLCTQGRHFGYSGNQGIWRMQKIRTGIKDTLQS